MTRRRFKGFAALAAPVLALWAVGCTAETEVPETLTVREVAESLVRTSVADQSGLGELAPLCPEVPTPAVGAVWQCTAATEDERVVTLEGLINEDGKVEVATTNVITAAALPSFEESAATALMAKNSGVTLNNEAVDCGDQSVVLTAEQTVPCSLLDPVTGGLYDMTLTIVELETRQFSLVVASQPRS